MRFAAAILAGLIPAVRAARLDPNDVLKSAGPRASGSRGDRGTLRALTIAQTALTLALLVGAGLLMRTMRNVWNVPAGFATDHVLTMTVTAVQGNWLDFHQRALERVSGPPACRSAAFAWGVPLTGTNWPGLIEVEGHPVVTPTDQIAVPLRSVTPGYFGLIQQPITDGRDFRATDDRKAPSVAIVNRRFVDRYFPSGNAIGKKLWLRGRDRPPTDIVGVIADSRADDLTQAAEPEVYLPLWQQSAFSKDLIVRTDGEPRAAFAGIQQALRATDPTVAIENARTLDQVRRDSVSSRTFATRLLVGFSGAAIVLTLVGIYGMLSLAVASRRREIAIRSAIGARRRDIRNLVFGEGFRLVGWGLVAGIAVALAMSRVWRVFLFDVQPTDPATLAGASILFAMVTLSRAGCRRGARPGSIRSRRSAPSNGAVPARGRSGRFARRYQRRGGDRVAVPEAPAERAARDVHHPETRQFVRVRARVLDVRDHQPSTRREDADRLRERPRAVRLGGNIVQRQARHDRAERARAKRQRPHVRGCEPDPVGHAFTACVLTARIRRAAGLIDRLPDVHTGCIPARQASRGHRQDRAAPAAEIQDALVARQIHVLQNASPYDELAAPRRVEKARAVQTEHDAVDRTDPCQKPVVAAQAHDQQHERDNRGDG